MAAARLPCSVSGPNAPRHTARVHALLLLLFRALKVGETVATFLAAGHKALRVAAQALVNKYAKSSA